jgi:hypothetical protein
MRVVKMPDARAVAKNTPEVGIPVLKPPPMMTPLSTMM